MVKKAADKIDAKLIEGDVVEKNLLTDYQKVHDFLNKNVKLYDSYLKEDDFKSCEVELRSWLQTLKKQGAGPEKLNSYLKVGMAHLCYDYIDVNEEGSELSEDEKISRALKSFKMRRFNKMFIRN